MAHSLTFPIRRFVAITTIALTLLAAGVTVAPTADAAIRRPERKLARLVNRYRVNRGVDRLALSRRLSRVAERNSQRMREQGAILHTNPGDIRCNGQKGEVSGAGDGVYGAFQNLRRSQPHRVIILRSYWERMGTGVAKRDGGLTYVTIIFCA